MTNLNFKDWIFDQFTEWEISQPGKRSSFSAFARWLSDNSSGTEIKQQMLSDWIKGRYKPKEEKYIFALAEKLGNDVFDALGKSRPNKFLYRIHQVFDNIPPDKQQQLAEQAERFEIENGRNKISRLPKAKKA